MAYSGGLYGIEMLDIFMMLAFQPPCSDWYNIENPLKKLRIWQKKKKQEQETRKTWKKKHKKTWQKNKTKKQKTWQTPAFLPSFSTAPDSAFAEPRKPPASRCNSERSSVTRLLRTSIDVGCVLVSAHLPAASGAFACGLLMAKRLPKTICWRVQVQDIRSVLFKGEETMVSIYINCSNKILGKPYCSRSVQRKSSNKTTWSSGGCELCKVSFLQVSSPKRDLLSCHVFFKKV